MSYPCPIPSHASRVCWCALALATMPACGTTPAERGQVIKAAVVDAPRAACITYALDATIPRDPKTTAACAAIAECTDP